MGLAKRWWDTEKNDHIKFQTGKSFTGTASYASVHSHQGEELSRRDDMESIGYVLIYLLKSKLPWQNLNSVNKSERYRMIRQKKESTSIESLTQGCPEEFKLYLEHCRALSFK